MKKICLALAASAMLFGCSDSEQQKNVPSFSAMLTEVIQSESTESELSLDPGATYVLDGTVELVRENIKINSGKDSKNPAIVDCRYSENKLVLKRRTKLDIEGVEFKNCLQIAEVESGSVEMLDSKVIGDPNRGEGEGAIFQLSSPRSHLSMENVRVQNNSTSLVVAKKGSSVTLNAVVFSDNKGPTPIKVYSGRLDISGGSEFVGNTSSEGAGVIRVIESQDVKISNSTFTANEAGPAARYERRTSKTSAGAISAYNSQVEIVDTIFNGNFGEVAGAIDMDNTTAAIGNVVLIFDGVRIFNHEVEQRKSAGAVNLKGTKLLLEQKDSVVKGNHGESCGGINLNYSSEISLLDPSLAGVYINVENNSSNRKIKGSDLCDVGVKSSRQYIR